MGYVPKVKIFQGQIEEPHELAVYLNYIPKSQPLATPEAFINQISEIASQKIKILSASKTFDMSDYITYSDCQKYVPFQNSVSGLQNFEFQT